MRLKLCLGGNVIASIPLNTQKAQSLEYIYAQRCLLVEACATLIAAHKETPVYFIEVASKMNKAVKE